MAKDKCDCVKNMHKRIENLYKRLNNVAIGAGLEINRLNQKIEKLQQERSKYVETIDSLVEILKVKYEEK